MTTTNTMVSASYGCKAPDGRHIYGDNGRCLICWQMNGNSDEVSRVMVIVISGEGADREQVNRIAEIIEGQVRGVFTTVALIQDESRQIQSTTNVLDLQVYAS